MLLNGFSGNAVVTQDYASASPYPCCILDGLNFLPHELLEYAALQAEALARHGAGVSYDNPLERKFVSGPADWVKHEVTRPIGNSQVKARTRSEELTRPTGKECERIGNSQYAPLPGGNKANPLSDVVQRLSSQDWLDFLTSLTGIQKLRTDPSMYGAGLSVVKRGGKLALHRDLQIQPESKHERRVNLALFLNREWQDEWGGLLELWSECGGRPNRCARRIRPKFGRILLFDPAGFHGFPDTIQCPVMESRLSLQLFYYTVARSGSEDGRQRAEFKMRPDDDPNEVINEFRLATRHKA